MCMQVSCRNGGTMTWINNTQPTLKGVYGRMCNYNYDTS